MSKKMLRYRDDKKNIQRLAIELEKEIKEIREYVTRYDYVGISAKFINRKSKFKVKILEFCGDKGITFKKGDNIINELRNGNKQIIEQIAEIMIKRGLVENYHEYKLAYRIKQAIEKYREKREKNSYGNKKKKYPKETYVTYKLEILPEDFKFEISFDKPSDLPQIYLYSDIKNPYYSDLLGYSALFDGSDYTIKDMAKEFLYPVDAVGSINETYLEYEKIIQQAIVSNPDLDQWVSYNII
jgi:hypothetical protein